MTKAHNLFFKFAGLHSLLMGLLPFYIPVLLWQQGYVLWQLSFFIAFTGLGFLLALPLWRNLYWDNQWNTLLRASFILEILLLSLVLCIESLHSIAGLFLIALLNGAYLCFYWTSQRTLFTQLNNSIEHSKENKTTTGNNFGNFQIVVMILLKVGILLSAFLLEQDYEMALLILSMSIAVFGIIHLRSESSIDTEGYIQFNVNSKPSDIKIDKPTQVAFFFDGLFLYLESYFWLLSLYLIAQQDIMQLGLLVVGLTLLLAALFWLIKGRIDAFPVNTIFQLAIMGYAVSWLLRGFITSDSNPADINYPIILIIAFLTSFFRLSFNKRFFDHVNILKTNQPEMIQYLLDKSTLSQLGVLFFFSLLGILLFALPTPNPLSWIYMSAAPLVLLYGFYSQPLENTQGRPSCTR
jgi:hypothetical protein